MNHRGYLAYRLFWDGHRSWEGTGLKDTVENRRKLERKAEDMSDEMAEGRFDYLHWFPTGNLAAQFRPVAPVETTVPTLGEYAEATWLPRKVPPMVRATLADTYRSHLRVHIVPRFGETLLSGITTARLEDFRADLTRSEREGGRGLKMKTARDIMDGTFRALYRDARQIDKLVTGDPFAALRWPRKVTPVPDPFDAEERDAILAYFEERDRCYYPFVFLHFWTGMRPGEVIGLRRGDVDLKKGTITVRRSRTMGEDNAPKTRSSERTIKLLPEVVAVLRAMPRSIAPSETAFVFTNRNGDAIEQERWVDQHWRRVFAATGIRPRKFYATRHTFISLAASNGANLKWLAGYCGTSVEMLERHYAKWLGADDEQLALLTRGRAAGRRTARKVQR